MSMLSKLADLFVLPSQQAVLSGGVHVLYVQESYHSASRSARDAGLEFLLEPDITTGISDVSVSHYWPPLRHNRLRRECPELFSAVTGLGGVSERNFHKSGGCIIVDNSVDTGQTLWMTSEFLKVHHYTEGQILVAASVWVNGRPSRLQPFEVRPLALFDSKLKEAERTLKRDLSPFFPTQYPTSLPEAIAKYCAVV